MDSGDISSFVTNGEWDLIGENWALYRNMNNSTDKTKINNPFIDKGRESKYKKLF